MTVYAYKNWLCTHDYKLLRSSIHDQLSCAASKCMLCCYMLKTHTQYTTTHVQTTNYTLTHTRTHTHTHIHSHTHTLTHALTHSHTHSHTHAYTHTRNSHMHTHARTHTRTHTLTHALTHSHTHTLTHAHTHSYTHAHTHTHTHTLTHTQSYIHSGALYCCTNHRQLFHILIWTFFFPQNSFDAGNADLQVHDPHAIAGTTYTTIPWTHIPLASSQHHFLHYKYLPYNHTNTSLSPCLLSLSRCSQDVSAWVARSSSHKKNVHRMGEGSRVSALVPRGSLVHGALKFVRVVIFREISSLVMMLLWGNCVRHNAHVHLL